MAHDPTRGYTRADLERLYSPLTQHGIKAVTDTLDGTDTQEVKIFGDVASRVSLQADGTLVCTVDITVNGTDWIQIAAGVDKNAIVTYDTHNMSAMRITRTAGTGKLHIMGAI